MSTDELLQVSRSAINSIMRERDEAVRNAQNAYAMRDAYDQRIADLETALQQERARADRLEALLAGRLDPGYVCAAINETHAVVRIEDWWTLKRSSERAGEYLAKWQQAIGNG
jgi:recombinational DNA repair ATPase RecF